MRCLISFTLVAVNVGLVAGFAGVWLRAWGLAYLAVVPAILFLAPIGASPTPIYFQF